MEFHAFTAAYLTALRAGDPPTEQHFVAYFSQLLLIKLRARRCDANEIDEITQETFVRVLAALRRQDALRDAARFGAYVNSVCNNVFLERLRGARRAGLVQGDGDGGLDLEQAPAEVIDLESRLVTDQARRRVREVLAGLSARDKQLLRAIFFDETPKDEICRQFGVDREYLRVLLHRAKQHFRERYTGDANGHAGSQAPGQQAHSR
jgi:RNA polymerase sigma-70 factor (ECF subfamily)